MRNRKDLRITVILSSLLLIAFLIIPEGSMFNEVIICPTRRFFHIPCPLCGMTRATWLLVHGRWAEAWSFNPGIFPLAALFLLMIPAAWGPERWHKIFTGGIWVCIGLILLNYILTLVLSQFIH